MNKRAFALALIIVAALGSGGLALRYATANREYFQVYQPTEARQAPEYLYPIGGNRPNELKKPLGAAVRGGRLYITSATGRVLVTDREGSKYRSIDLGPESTSPRSVAVDDEGRAYISLGQSERVVVLDPSGRSVEEEDFAGAELIKPVGLAHSKSHIYVTDVGDHSVKVFTLGGRLVKKVGGSESGRKQFSYPNGVAVAADGTVYVADSNNSSVKVFDKDDQYVTTLPQPSNEQDRILLPRAVAIDRLGRIHVVDTLRSLVHVYSVDYEHLFIYGQEGGSGARLGYPNSIYIDDETGLIFIADRLNDRVAVWAEK